MEIRSLIEKIVLQPVGDGLQIELHGDLAGILAVSERETDAKAADQHALQIKMVAGVGFEPTTFRL